MLLDARTGSLLTTTAWLVVYVCVMAVPLGTWLGWLLARTDLPGRRVGLGLFGLMLVVPLYLQAAAWQAGFEAMGWFAFGSSGPSGSAWLDGFHAVAWIHAVAALPWVVWITAIGLWLTAPELEERAVLDASPHVVFFRVTLPSMFPAVGVAALWTTLVVAGEMTVTDLFGVRTFAEEVFTDLSLGVGEGETPLGRFPSILITSCLALGAFWLIGRVTSHDHIPSMRRRFVFRLGAWRIPLAVVAGVVLATTIGVPLLSLGHEAGMRVVETESRFERVWSFTKLCRTVLFSPWRYSREFGWSMLIGTLAAGAAVAGGLATAWIARHGRLARAMLWAVLAVLVALPGPLIGQGVILLLNRPGLPWLCLAYDQSILAPWLVLTARGFPLATLVSWYILSTVPREELEAARLDGAGFWRRLISIALPGRWGTVSIAYLTVLAVVLGEVAGTSLVAPPGVETLAFRIFRLLHYGVEDQVAGVCLAQLIGLAMIAVAGWWVVARQGRRGVQP